VFIKWFPFSKIGEIQGAMETDVYQDSVSVHENRSLRISNQKALSIMLVEPSKMKPVIRYY